MCAAGVSSSPEVGRAGLSGSPEVGKALLSDSPEVGKAGLISSPKVGDAGQSSSPVLIGPGHGGIGVDEVIVHGLLVLGFLIIWCPRKFLCGSTVVRLSIRVLRVPESKLAKTPSLTF